MREGSTPIRQQYLRIKRRYPQAIVFFRLGDFYETFDEDAKLASLWKSGGMEGEEKKQERRLS